MPKFEQPKPIMTPEEQENLDKFLAEQKEQEAEFQESRRIEKEDIKEVLTLTIEEERDIEKKLVDQLSNEMQDTPLEEIAKKAKEMVKMIKENLELRAEINERALRNKTSKKLNIEQVVATLMVFGSIATAGYSPLQEAGAVERGTKTIERGQPEVDKDAFNNYINDFRNPGVSADNLCAWISQNVDEMNNSDMQTILTAVKNKFQHFTVTDPLEAYKVIDTLNKKLSKSSNLKIDSQLAQDVINNMPGRTKEDWRIWLADDKNWQKTNEALNFLSLYAEPKVDSLPDIAELSVMEPVIRDALERYSIEKTAANRKKILEIIDERWHDYEQRKVFGKNVVVIAVAGSGAGVNIDSMVKMANPIANVPERSAQTRHGILKPPGRFTPAEMERPNIPIKEEKSKEIFSLSPDKNAGEYPIYSFKCEESVPKTTINLPGSGGQKQKILHGIRSCPNEQLTFWFEGHMLTFRDENKNPVERRLWLSTKNNPEDRNATISAFDLANALEARFRNNPNSKTTIMLGGCYSHIFKEEVYKILTERGLPYSEMPVIISASAPNIREGKAKTAIIESDRNKEMSMLSVNLREAMNQRNDRTSTKLSSLLRADESGYKNQGDFHTRFQIVFPISPEKIKEKFPEADFGEEGSQKPPILEVGYLEQKESEFFYA